jgi:hypothetical protein
LKVKAGLIRPFLFELRAAVARFTLHAARFTLHASHWMIIAGWNYFS